MFDYLVLLSLALLVWSGLVLITSGVITLLEHLYCNCKPEYRFTDYTPSTALSVLFWPVILPLLLVELAYMTTYCLVRNLRN